MAQARQLVPEGRPRPPAEAEIPDDEEPPPPGPRRLYWCGSFYNLAGPRIAGQRQDPRIFIDFEFIEDECIAGVAWKAEIGDERKGFHIQFMFWLHKKYKNLTKAMIITRFRIFPHFACGLQQCWAPLDSWYYAIKGPWLAEEYPKYAGASDMILGARPHTRGNPPPPGMFKKHGGARDGAGRKQTHTIQEYDNLVQKIMRGDPALQVMRSPWARTMPFHVAYELIQRSIQPRYMGIGMKRLNMIVKGPPGKGKETAVEHWAIEHGLRIYWMVRNADGIYGANLDGYDGQEVIAINEFRGQYVSFDAWKDDTGRIEFRGNVKRSTVVTRAWVTIMVTNWEPEVWEWRIFNKIRKLEGSDEITAFLRRLAKNHGEFHIYTWQPHLHYDEQPLLPNPFGWLDFDPDADRNLRGSGEQVPIVRRPRPLVEPIEPRREVDDFIEDDGEDWQSRVNPALLNQLARRRQLRDAQADDEREVQMDAELPAPDDSIRGTLGNRNDVALSPRPMERAKRTRDFIIREAEEVGEDDE